MMEEFEVFMDAAGCDESTIQHLIQNGITSTAILREIAENYKTEFKEIIPSLGTRISLEWKLAEELKSRDGQGNLLKSHPTESVSSDYEYDNTLKDESILNNSSIIIRPHQSLGQSSLDEPPTKVFVLETTGVEDPRSSPQTTSVIIESEVQDFKFRLSDLLDTTTTGRAIKAIYSLKHSLDSRCQSYLVEIIVQHFINIVPFRRLNNSDFDSISKEIVTCFPNELKEVYYTKPIIKKHSRDNKSTIARGKLVDKYRNRLTFLREAGIIQKRIDVNEDGESRTPSTSVDYELYKEDLIWLQNNDKPWTEVLEKWGRTYEFRETFLKRDDIDISNIIEKFPLISHSMGFTLIDYDFKKRFPEQFQAIYENFQTIFYKLLQIRKKTLNQSDLLVLEIIQSETLNQESRHYLMLTLLASLLPTKNLNKKLKNKWHPTSKDAKEGLIVHVKIAGDVANLIKHKGVHANKYGIPVLPFVVIEGPSSTEILKIYVSYENLLYEVPSVLRGIDVCFELIHVLNLVYPYQSEHIWMFIQLAVYNLKTSYDNIPNILDIVNKINKKV